MTIFWINNSVLQDARLQAKIQQDWTTTTSMMTSSPTKTIIRQCMVRMRKIIRE